MSKDPITAYVKGQKHAAFPAYEWTKADVLLFEEWERCAEAGEVPDDIQSRMDDLNRRIAEVDKKGFAWFQRQSALLLFRARKASISNGAIGYVDGLERTKRKKAAEKVVAAERNAPRMNALATFRRKQPGCTLPQAAAEIFRAGTTQTEASAKKWLRDMVKAGAIERFEPGKKGRPPESRGVSVRKP